jgi:STE24 endopeptidase
VLASHFDPGVFEKSQNYGKDKAKFALFSGIFKQLLDSLMLQYGFYAWSWGLAGTVLAKAGYGAEYQVTLIPLICAPLVF